MVKTRKKLKLEKCKMLKENKYKKKKYSGITENVKSLQEECKSGSSSLSKLELSERQMKWSQISSYCRPGQVLSLINDLKEKKPTELGVIESFGFGGLLKLRLSEFIRNMLPCLIESFDPNGHLFIAVKGIKEFVVTKYDCKDVFLLPCSDIAVELNTVSVKKEEYKYVKELKDHLGLPCSNISVAQLRECLFALPEGDSRFIQMFILYVCSVFLAPTSSQNINFSISKSLLDLEMIPKLDWCSYVLNDLCYSIKVFKGEIKSRSGEKKRITGCLLLLQILYFHRFMFRGLKEASDLPLIQHWDDKKFKERLKDEKFGLAMFDNTTYPISSKSILAVRSGNLLGQVNYQNVQPRSNEGDSVQVCSSSKRVVQFELPPHLETDEEISKKAGSNVNLRNILLYKRDVQLFCWSHPKRLIEMKESSNKPNAESDFSDFKLTDQDVKIIDKSVNHFKSMEDLVKSMRCVEGNKSDLVPFRSSSNNEQKQSSTLELFSTRKEDRSDQIINITLVEDFLKSFCNLDCGTTGCKLNFRSSFMTRNSRLMKGFPMLQQQALDFCFYSTSSERHFLSQKRVVLYGSDFHTLGSNRMIISNIISAWCKLLNNMVMSSNEDCRFYMDLSEMTPYVDSTESSENAKKWENMFIFMINRNIEEKNISEIFMRANMIFLPFIHNKHFFAVVVNFNLKTIQLLDNKSDTLTPSFTKTLQFLGMVFSNVLKNFNHPKSDDLSLFEFEEVPFDWKSNDLNLDCGVFLMITLWHFKGDLFTCDLSQLMRRRLYRASIAAALVLSETNELRDEFLQKVEKFSTKKYDTRQKDFS